MQRLPSPDPVSLLAENERVNKELYSIKMELYEIYQENIRLKQIIHEQERDKAFVRECEEQLIRLKTLLKDVTDKKESMPTQRQEIKDRIIMKLEDELISARIQLKEATLQLHKLTRMQ